MSFMDIVCCVICFKGKVWPLEVRLYPDHGEVCVGKLPGERERGKLAEKS